MSLIDDRTRKWWVLAAMGGALGLIVLDETVVGVALPTIRPDLGMSVVGGHWVVNAYLLTFTGFVAAGGKLGDIVDIRNLFLTGLAIFGVASCAAGFAPDGATLIAARAVQGVGAALLFPLAVAMITAVFPPEQRGLALGIQTATAGTFLSLGPLVGGYFTATFSWRWIFWVNLPVVAFVALALVLAWKPAERPAVRARLDVAGLAALLIGLGAVVLGAMQGAEWGWSSPLIVGLLAGGAVALVAFVVTETRVRNPLIDVSLFRNPTFTVANLVIFTGQAHKIAVFVFAALYLQHVVGMSPVRTGLALVPGIVCTPFTSILAGRLADRLGPRPLFLVGLALSGAAMFAMALAVPSGRYLPLLPSLFVWGAVLPLHFVPPRRAQMNAVTPDKHGQVGGISLTAQLLGGTIAMAVMGAVFATTGKYAPIYYMAGGLAAFSLVAAWFTVERQPRAG